MKEDYPRNLLEFEERFATEEACREYVMKTRWPDGYVCPKCGGRRAWQTKRNLLVCAECEHQASVTAGTIFERTRKPLRVWFRAMWWVTTQKTGASALGLQRELGLGTYWTAWTWLHKLRRAMVRPGRDRVSGTIEVDETYWGAEEKGVIGRLTHEKTLIIVAAQRDGKKVGRIRLGRLPALTKKKVHAFVRQAVEPGSTLVTDGLNVYSGVTEYKHRPIILKQESEDASSLLPLVHRVVSLLKRWLLGTHQGAVHPEHLDYYLDEFTFRFNRRTSVSRGKLFFRLMQNAVQVPPAPYRDLNKHVSPGPDHNI